MTPNTNNNHIKLIPRWFVENRDSVAAYHFVHDLDERLANRVQLTSDGHKPNLSAVVDAFGADVDYAILIKLYGNAREGGKVPYSPAQCMGSCKTVISGKTDYHHISTTHTELQYLSMRMGMLRFSRLTNAFSKKLQNHEHMIAIYFMNYNFCKIHQNLRATPATEAGITDNVWSLEKIVDLLNIQPGQG